MCIFRRILRIFFHRFVYNDCVHIYYYMVSDMVGIGNNYLNRYGHIQEFSHIFSYIQHGVFRLSIFHKFLYIHDRKITLVHKLYYKLPSSSQNNGHLHCVHIETVSSLH